MSIIVPLHKWRSADPAILIGRRCIARADGTLDFEPVCPISLLSRQLDVMDAYANLLRCRAKIEHVNLEKQDSATE